MKKIATYGILILLCSCVSESKYQKLLNEKEGMAYTNKELKQKIDNLEAEIEELKFGAKNLFSDGEEFYKAKDYRQAKNKFETLLQKHPSNPLSIKIKPLLVDIDDQILWQEVLNKEDIKLVDEYLTQYPNGQFLGKANARKKELKALEQEKAYENAKERNTSYAWKQFLEEYPDYPQKSAISEKIIRLEVDELFGSSSTGKMPSFDNYSSSYSSISSVKITNDTGCELTIRYSGTEAKMLNIPKGETRTISLKSGSYRIVASACGANYAGTENLQGDYGSTFYINTSYSRY